MLAMDHLIIAVDVVVVVVAGHHCRPHPSLEWVSQRHHQHLNS